jgi:farnesyl diphosphate synthase
MLRELAFASGAAGMCGGQALDIAATGTRMSIEALERMHALKTGALLRAAVRLGALAAGAGAGERVALDRYADALGLAFQVRDDLLDIEGDSATLGKTAGKDQAQAKATFPALIGVEASRARLLALAAEMEAALAPLGPRGGALAALARHVVERDH